MEGIVRFQCRWNLRMPSIEGFFETVVRGHSVQFHCALQLYMVNLVSLFHFLRWFVAGLLCNSWLVVAWQLPTTNVKLLGRPSQLALRQMRPPRTRRMRRMRQRRHRVKRSMGRKTARTDRKNRVTRVNEHWMNMTQRQSAQWIGSNIALVGIEEKKAAGSAGSGYLKISCLICIHVRRSSFASLLLRPVLLVKASSSKECIFTPRTYTLFTKFPILKTWQHCHWTMLVRSGDLEDKVCISAYLLSLLFSLVPWKKWYGPGTHGHLWGSFSGQCE